MSRATVDLTPPTPIESERGRHRRVIRRAAAVVVVLVTLAAVGWLARGDDDASTARTTPSTAAPAGQPTTAPRASAADVLSAFVASAEGLDAQLRAAATAINSVGPPWSGVSQEVAGAVRSAALEPVAETIPPGLPTDILRSVILVYSDLSSRRHAIESFSTAPDLPYEPSDLLAELANGHAAATRFDSDLGALRSLAAASPPITVAGPKSRDAAETLLLVRFVDLANGGCGSRGGAVFPELPSLDWIRSSAPDSSGQQWDGHVGGIPFRAALSPGGTWDVTIRAC